MFPMSPLLFVIERNQRFLPKWITFRENHLQNTKWIMDMIDFNKHDFFINDLWQKYVGDVNFTFDQ